jgi:hypothetical protein
LVVSPAPCSHHHPRPWRPPLPLLVHAPPRCLHLRRRLRPCTDLDRPLLFFCCAAPLTVDARTSTPPPRTRQRTTSTSATSTTRGYHLHGVHTGLYSSRNTRTLTTLRLRGISTCWLLSLAAAPVSSFVVLPLQMQGMLEFVFPYVSVDGLAPLLGC